MAELKKATKSSSVCTIAIRTIPRSSKISIAAEGPGNYKVRLTAPPVDGSANKQLLKFLSDKLSVPLRNIRILSGEHGRKKLLQIEGLSEHNVSQLLA
jgi:uncharacterized protein (TIGR00251 family)